MSKEDGQSGSSVTAPPKDGGASGQDVGEDKRVLTNAELELEADARGGSGGEVRRIRSEEHTSELQSR